MVSNSVGIMDKLRDFCLNLPKSLVKMSEAVNLPDSLFAIVFITEESCTVEKKVKILQFSLWICVFNVNFPLLLGIFTCDPGAPLGGGGRGGKLPTPGCPKLSNCPPWILEL